MLRMKRPFKNVWHAAVAPALLRELPLPRMAGLCLADALICFSDMLSPAIYAELFVCFQGIEQTRLQVSRLAGSFVIFAFKPFCRLVRFFCWSYYSFRMKL